LNRRTALKLLGGVGVLGASGAEISLAQSDGDNADSDMKAVWPEFQYNASHTGISGNGTGPEAGPLAEKWVNTFGEGAATSPLLADGRVYLGTAAADLVAYDASNGNELWRTAVRRGPGVRPLYTPAYANERVYWAGFDPVNTGAASVHAFDAETGEELWTNGYGSDASLTAVDGTVYATQQGGDDGLRAFDAESGEIQWHYDRTRIGSGPAVAEETVYTARDHLVALAAGDGRERWTTDLPSEQAGIPTIVGDTVYVQTFGRPSDPHSLVAVDTADGSVRWSRDLGTRPPGAEVSPAADDETVYLTFADGEREGVLTALDAATGEERWRFERNPTASPVVVNGFVYVVGDGSGTPSTDLFVLSAESGAVVSRYWGDGEEPDPGTAQGLAPPTVARGVAYLSTFDESGAQTGAGLFAVHDFAGDPPSNSLPDVTVDVMTDDPVDCQETELAVRFGSDEESGAGSAGAGDLGDDYLVTWDLGGDDGINTETAGNMLSRRFEAGTRTVRAVVVDRFGRRDEATTTFTVDARGEEPTTGQPGRDSDDDGLTDEEEEELGTDPTDPDTDGDGVTDCREVNVHDTDPTEPNDTA
jgi:outer membrane protein assembly factor BamB